MGDCEQRGEWGERGQDGGADDLELGGQRGRVRDRELHDVGRSELNGPDHAHHGLDHELHGLDHELHGLSVSSRVQLDCELGELCDEGERWEIPGRVLCGPGHDVLSEKEPLQHGEL